MKYSTNLISQRLMRPALEARQLPRVCFNLLLAFLLVACDSEIESSRGAQSDQDRAVKIIPHSVSYRSDVVEIEAVGTARAVKTAVIRADGAGEVAEIKFTAGQQVGAGEVLLELESVEERLMVDAAQIAVKDAEQIISRYDGIKLPGAISASRIDEAKIAAERAKVELALAKLALKKRQVLAPFSGTVGLTNIDPGARITRETEITQLDDRSRLYVDFQVPEEVYGRLEIGAVIDMEPFSNAAGVYQATVHKIDSRIDQASRSFTVRAEIDNEQDRLRPGMSFKINLELAGRTFPQVPEAAIIWGGDGAYVWMIENGQAKRQSVTIVSRTEGMVLVNAPITEGDIVVAEGVQKVRDGTRVEFVNAYGDAGQLNAKQDNQAP